MKYKDLACYDTILSKKEIQSATFTAIESGLNGISVLPCYLSKITSLSPPKGFVIACAIDYPYGTMMQEIRTHSIIKAIHKGANTIDLVLSQNDIHNNNIDSITNDLEANLAVCNKKGVTLRIMLEYRLVLSQLEMLRLLVTIASDLGINYIFPSTGFRVDDYTDNLISAKRLGKGTGVRTITNGNIWTPEQYEQIEKSKVYGVRLHSEQSVKNIFSTKNGYKEELL